MGHPGYKGRQCVPHCVGMSLPTVSSSILMSPKSPSARGSLNAGLLRRCLEDLPLSLVARKWNPFPPQPCGLSLSGF